MASERDLVAQSSDVLVIGGGIAGLSIAWALAKRDVSVRLLEAQSIGSGASSAALGALMPPAATRLQPFQNLQRKSLFMVEAMAQELGEYAQCDTGFVRCGRLDLLRTEQIQKMANAESLAATDRWSLVNGLPPQELLTAAETQELQPRLICPVLLTCYPSCC